MYTIIMNNDKALIASVRATLYQREKLVNKIQFLLPQQCEDVNIRDCVVLLKYVDQGNVSHAKKLIMDDDLYKEHIRCVLNVDTELTKFAGDIIASLSFLRLNSENGLHEEVLHTSNIIITISPVNDIFAFVTDESLEIIDKVMLELEAKTKALELVANTYDAEKADNLVLDPDQSSIYLSSNGIPIENSKIPLDSLGNAISDNTDNGLVRVITEDEVEIINPDSGDAVRYSLKLDDETNKLLLLANGEPVSSIETRNIGKSIIDSTPEGLNEIIT